MRRLLRENSGSLSIELALIAMALFFALLVIFDTMRVINGYMNLSAAIRSGMQYAIFRPLDSSGISAAVKSTSSELEEDLLDVENSTSCLCDNKPIACGLESCAGNMRTYITINASYNQPLTVIYPLIGSNMNLNRTTTFRVY